MGIVPVLRSSACARSLGVARRCVRHMCNNVLLCLIVYDGLVLLFYFIVLLPAVLYYALLRVVCFVLI